MWTRSTCGPIRRRERQSCSVRPAMAFPARTSSVCTRTRYDQSGFSASLTGLAPGDLYRRVLRAQFANFCTFSAVATLSGIVPWAPARVVVDMPAPGATVGLPFRIAGWAIDGTRTSQPGIDAVHVWAYPAAGGPVPGRRRLRRGRPDVGALLGTGFTNSGCRPECCGPCAGCVPARGLRAQHGYGPVRYGRRGANHRGRDATPR